MTCRMQDRLQYLSYIVGAAERQCTEPTLRGTVHFRTSVVETK